MRFRGASRGCQRADGGDAGASPGHCQRGGFPFRPALAPPLLLHARMRTRVARNRRAGFTLIELLVVIAIIGVLAAIAIPQFLSRQGKAYDARVMTDARNAAAAEEAYFDDNTAYYTGPCDALPGMSVSTGVSCTATAAGATFSVQTSHPSASRSCTWSSASSPSLSCS